MASSWAWPVPGPPTHTGEGESKLAMLAQAPPQLWLGAAQVAEWADRWVQLLPESEVSEVLDCSNFQHPFDGQGLLGDVVA